MADMSKRCSTWIRAAVGTANAFTGFPAKPIMSMPRTFTGSSNCQRANAGHLFVQVTTRGKPGSGGLETGFSLGAGMSENGHSTCDEQSRRHRTVVDRRAGLLAEPGVVGDPIEIGRFIQRLAKGTRLIVVLGADDVGRDATLETGVAAQRQQPERLGRRNRTYAPIGDVRLRQLANGLSLETVTDDRFGEASREILGDIENPESLGGTGKPGLAKAHAERRAAPRPGRDPQIVSWLDPPGRLRLQQNVLQLSPRLLLDRGHDGTHDLAGATSFDAPRRTSENRIVHRFSGSRAGYADIRVELIARE